MNATALMNTMDHNFVDAPLYATRTERPTAIRRGLSNLSLNLELSCLELNCFKRTQTRQYPALMATRHYKLSLRLRQMMRRGRKNYL